MAAPLDTSLHRKYGHLYCDSYRLQGKNGKVFVRSGAGIVADSVPEKEYEECINKARSSLKALKLAQEAEL